MSDATTIVEQAARRLDQLRRSGIELPPRATRVDGASGGKPAEPPPTLDAAARRPVRVHTNEAAAASARSFSPASKLVHIDQARLAAMMYVTPSVPRAQIVDEFRVVKRPLLLNARGRPGETPAARANLIMVTSSVPGEGKTFVAVNLAISIAMELDVTVLLVDADVSRPSVLQRFGLSPSAGLLDVLTNPSLALGSVLMRTDIDRLSLLPAGAPHGHATELLASQSMDRLLGEMAGRYADRVVVFDAPPLLPSTESRVLATRMGQVVVVVEADRTPQKSVAQALATLESCPQVLPLLNKVPRSEVGSYHGYYEPIGG